MRSFKLNRTTSTFLVDNIRDYAQVLAETNSSGLPSVSYLYGDELIQQSRGGANHFYLHDAHGSTRALSNATGTLTDRYDYHAHGTLLDQTDTTENIYRHSANSSTPD